MISFLVAWLGVMVPLVLSPGPANVVFAASGAKFGVTRSLNLLAGIDSVFVIKSLLVGFGLGALFQTYPPLLYVIQIIGSFYILLLAYRFLKSSSSKVQTEVKQLSLFDGAMIQVLNAKGWLLVVLMFSLFTRPAELQFGESGVLVLCLLLALLNVSCHLIWIAFGSMMQKVLNMGNHERLQNIIFAAALACVSVGLLIGLYIDLV